MVQIDLLLGDFQI